MKSIVRSSDRDDDCWCSAALVQDLHAAGFDICHPFCPQWYNQRIADEQLLDAPLRPLPHAGGRRALLIGNTKRLWRPFLQWWCQQRQQQQQQQQQQQHLPANPLDTYCREKIEAIVFKHWPPRKTQQKDDDDDDDDDENATTTRIFWSSSNDEDGTLVSMQRVALVSGLAYWDAEATAQLSIHPVFGPWLSYRAVVVVVVDAMTKTATDSMDPDPPPPPATVRLSPTEQRQARQALQRAVGLCGDAATLCQQLHQNLDDDDDDDDHKIVRAWIAVRDCIETGRATHRFGANQLLYHYTKNTKYLLADDDDDADDNWDDADGEGKGENDND